MTTDTSDHRSDGESSSDEEMTAASPPAPIVESLVAGRVRRSTAGNRLQSLLNQEADAEDVIFQEFEDDVEFEGGDAEDLSDLQLESSDEDEDDGGAGGDGEKGDEELEGEKELQQQVKEEKAAKKRKAAEAFMKPRAPRKRVTIREEGSAVTTPADGKSTQMSPPRQKKKSERVSWIPEFTATRSSSRTLSLQNRSETMRRLEESEKRRLHTIKLMEAAAAKKDKENPRRDLTQAERLEEAKLTEELNRKSLNKWEEAEAVRLEEQRKKLAALQNRKLVGPVITWWSGRAEWDENGKITKIGKGIIEELDDGSEGEGKKGKSKKKAKSKAKGKGKQKELEKEDGEDVKPIEQTEVDKREKNPVSSVNSSQLSTPKPAAPSTTLSTAVPTPSIPSPTQSQPQMNQKHHGQLPLLLEGILDYAALPETPPSKPENPADEAAPLPPPPRPVIKPLVPKVEYSTRNLVVLENFDPEAVRNREGIVKVLFPSDSKRLWPTHKTLCVITHQPAKFRDPTTGMTYASLQAYRDIQKIMRGEIQWSCLLGAYVGVANTAAKGVPEGFLKDA